jgi:hypothetical protein
MVLLFILLTDRSHSHVLNTFLFDCIPHIAHSYTVLLHHFFSSGQFSLLTRLTRSQNYTHTCTKHAHTNTLSHAFTHTYFTQLLPTSLSAPSLPHSVSHFSELHHQQHHRLVEEVYGRTDYSSISARTEQHPCARTSIEVVNGGTHQVRSVCVASV